MRNLISVSTGIARSEYTPTGAAGSQTVAGQPGGPGRSSPRPIKLPGVSSAPGGRKKSVETLLLPVDPLNLAHGPARAALETAATVLRTGGLVALPTETVYGLGAN